MGRKSRSKQEAKRSVTEFVFSVEDEKEYKVTEFHPDKSPPSNGEVLKQVGWTHIVNPTGISPFLKTVLHKMPKKRVFLMNNEKGSLIVGFYPSLTELETQFMASLTEGLTDS